MIPGDQALVPYINGIDSFSQRAGSDIGMVYGGGGGGGGSGGDNGGETPLYSGMQLLIFPWKFLRNVKEKKKISKDFFFCISKLYN